MTPPTTPLVESYQKAVEANDPARASEAWRAAQGPGKEAERKAMIQTLDFSLVENYSFAQAIGDLSTMSAIWTRALHTPDAALARLLNTVSNRNIDLPPEESEPETKQRNQKAQSFLDELLSRPLKLKPENTASPTPVPQTATHQGVPVSELLTFAEDPVRRSFCGLTQPDIDALKSLGHMLLPGAESHDSMKQWARDHQLGLTDSQIGRIHKVSLLFRNQMVPSDANMLAMAARSAKGKKGKESPPPNSLQKDSAPPTNQGSHPE